MRNSTLIVSQALISNQDGVTLHPDLLLWQQQLAKRRQKWFFCSERSPLEWYASLQSLNATSLLASRVTSIPDSCSQCWLVTPYHAQLLRDSIRICPEGMLDYSEEDAEWLCKILNPHLIEEGMQLLHYGSALLLTCKKPLDAFPDSFASISGNPLPDTHPEGTEGGRLNRLMAEVQMILHQNPSETRHQHGDAEINGIWLSSPTSWPQQVDEKQIAVATRNPALASVVDGRGAKVIVSEAERVDELLKSILPDRVVLVGEGYAVIMEKTLMPVFGKLSWRPSSLKDEDNLITVLMRCM